jgi:AraC-like DNA-binding protein
MPEDFILTDEPAPGVRRLVAGFQGHAYDPHRHETYAIGHTLSGAQAFRYRGVGRVSSAGECMVIHPDEVHDGHAPAATGFRYRMVYVEPWLIHRASDGHGGLPFVPEVVASDPSLSALLEEMFEDFGQDGEPLAWDGHIARLAELLMGRSDNGKTVRIMALPEAEVAKARAMMSDEFARPLNSSDLEQATGLDRFELARAFRRLAGTSPYRYLLGRRLEAARRAILSGEEISHVAAGVGFADQAHMTRHFKARYGITPGRMAMLARGRT